MPIWRAIDGAERSVFFVIGQVFCFTLDFYYAEVPPEVKMPFMFDEDVPAEAKGMPYLCPSDGRLIVIIGNFGGNIEARFVSYAPGPTPYHGLHRLSFQVDLATNSQAHKGLVLGKQPLGTKPYEEFSNALLLLILAVGRYAIDTDFDPDPRDRVTAPVIKVAQRPDRTVFVLKPLGAPLNFAPTKP